MKAADRLAAKRYAKAFCEAAGGNISTAADAFAAVYPALASVSQLFNPTVDKEEKRKFLTSVLAGADKIILGLMLTLLGSGRLNILSGVAEEIFLLSSKMLGVAHIKVVSARAIDNKTKKRIEDAAKRFFSARTVFADYAEDAALLTGVVIEGEGVRIDNSGRGQLERLEKALTDY
ncbi:ATP synthase [Parelusimicrobium proximum]|uniref:ATP synthase F1 subunit delta n=1 Tax=Parelusimicrobium proximum TaxID=3228953 RepID=UPI003D176A24